MSKYIPNTRGSAKPKDKQAESKSTKMGATELSDMIKAAVKEALTGGDAGGKEDDPGEDSGGLDYEEVMEIVAEAIEAATEKRKSKSDAGEEVAEDPYEDIMEAVADILEELDDGEEMSDDEDDEEKASDGREEPREEGDEGKGKGKRKTAGRPSQSKGRKKSRRPTASPPQRKYSDIYFSRTGEPRVSQNQKKIPPEIQLARAVKCLDVFGRNDPERAAHAARTKYNDEAMERQFKALAATLPSTGGYLIPEAYLDEIIEMLYSRTVVFELGARKVPMPNGNLNIPKQTSGARARWGGEARPIAKTQTAFGNVRLSAKRLEAIVPVTRELLMSTEYSADALFANDLIRRMQLGIDYGALYGTGGEFQPRGISDTKGILTIDAKKLDNPELADNDGKLTADFPVYITGRILIENVDDLGLGWSFNSLMEAYLKNLKTTTGAYIYREEMNAGKLNGFPFKISNQIPMTSAFETEMFFGNWADLLVGEQLGLETYTTLDGVWTDEDGVQHSAFEENLSATRALMYVDIAVRHTESFARIKNAKIA